jgi:hypothetical protein
MLSHGRYVTSAPLPQAGTVRGVRHLRSILYALVLTPAVWILCGVGFDQDLTGRARDNGGIESLSGVLLLVLAGAAYAILLFSPISPLGPLLAGLTFLGIGAWARIAPSSYAGVWPENVASDGFDLSTPGYGLVVLLAVPLLCVALSARRWRAYEPPEILLLGTIGRAHGAAPVAGTPMASERTTVIPQQRQAAERTAVIPQQRQAAETTQIVPPARPVGRPFDDGDEKTTVMQLGRPPAPGPGAEGDEPTRIVPPAAEPATVDLTADETTRDVVASGTTPAAPEDETTGNVTGDETTRLVLPAGDDARATEAFAAATDDGDEKTQLLTLPKADGEAGHGEQTQQVRTGTVEPPGDRTQLLTFPAPGAPAPVQDQDQDQDPGQDSRESTKALTIAGAERPDPGEDPTTRLTPPGRPPAEAPTRAHQQAHPATVTSLERPADEAADDTRPLTLPAPRAAADDDTTRHL